MSREVKLAKNTFILSIGTFFPKLAAFITLPILTACLTKEQYGTYDLITILVSLLLPVTTLLIHAASFRFLIEHKNDKEYAKLYFTNSVSFSVPVSIVSLAVLYFFLPIDSIAIKIWICLYLFFDAMVANVRQITRGMSRNLDYSISAIISAAIKVVFAIILVQILKYELLGAVVTLALSSFVSLLFLIFKIKAYELLDLRLVNRKTIKEMLSYSWPMVPNNMSSWVMSASDRFVVTGFKGLPANAVYAVANKIPNLLGLAQSTFSMAWQENASIASSDEDVGKYYSKMFKVMNNFYTGCLGLIIACTPLLFKLLIRGDYSEAYPQMPVLFLSVFFHCMASFFGGIYIAFKKTRSVGITTVVAALVNLLVDLALIESIGLFAASGSTLISYMLLFFYRMSDVRKIVKIKYDMKAFMLSMLILIIECTLCFINNTYVNIINVCFGVAMFFLLNKEVVGKIIEKLRKKVLKSR